VCVGLHVRNWLTEVIIEVDHLAGLLGIRGGGRLSTARVLCVGLGRGGGNLQQLLAAALVAMPHRGRDERVLLVLAADGGAQLASDGGREAVAGEQVVPQQLRARRSRLGIQAQTQLQSPIKLIILLPSQRPTVREPR